MAIDDMIPSEIMTVKNICAYLKCSKSMIYRLIKRGELPAFRLQNRDWRFVRADIDRWFLEKTRVAVR